MPRVTVHVDPFLPEHGIAIEAEPGEMFEFHLTVPTQGQDLTRDEMLDVVANVIAYVKKHPNPYQPRDAGPLVP